MHSLCPCFVRLFNDHLHLVEDFVCLSDSMFPHMSISFASMELKLFMRARGAYGLGMIRTFFYSPVGEDPTKERRLRNSEQ